MSLSDVWTLVQVAASGAVALIGFVICMSPFGFYLLNPTTPMQDFLAGLCCYFWMLLPAPVLMLLGAQGMWNAAREFRDRSG